MRTKKRDRIERADERRVERESRTTAQQIAYLDRILGEGVGALKERTRLTLPEQKSPKKNG